MALGVAAICTLASGYYIAYGIWCGFMFTLTGGLHIGAARHRNTCLIMVTMVLSILCACLGAIQFGIGVVAASNDQTSVRGDVVYGNVGPGYLDYDIYYSINTPYGYYCAGQNLNITWHYSWGPIDVLLLLTGFIELVVAVISACMCCNSVCCGARTVTAAVPGVHYQTGTLGTVAYSNDGYQRESSHLTPSPPLYRIM